MPATPLSNQPRANQSQRLPSGIHCRYEKGPLEGLLDNKHVLFAVGYKETERAGVTPLVSAPQTDDPRYLLSGLVPFTADQQTTTEVWYSDKPVVCGRSGELAWARSEDFAFAAIEWETDLESGKRSELIERAAYAYNKLLAFVEAEAYPNLIRVWNYLPDINLGEGDEEHYRLFCHGRHEAFSHRGYPLHHFPSASALGHHQTKSVIYLIAARRPGRHFENPQQVSAYHYPRQYGTRSPSFARATLLQHLEQDTLFISGTASVIGHQTLHPNRCDLQLEVTLRNIDTLLGHIGEHLGRKPGLSLLKVYVRRPEHLELTKRAVQAHMGSSVPALYLHSDICRRDLLVEIEGICELPPSLHSPAAADRLP